LTWETTVEEVWKRFEDMSGHVRIVPNDTHSTQPNTDIEEPLTEKHAPTHVHTHTHTHGPPFFFLLVDEVLSLLELQFAVTQKETRRSHRK
jgi:hypothetical protein